MTFAINFSARKPAKNIANTNIHDDLYWHYAYDLAEATTPLNQWPRQYIVHYIYEFMNRPWLPEKTRMENVTFWMLGLAPDLDIKLPSDLEIKA